jgi:hypothetical protein
MTIVFPGTNIKWKKPKKKQKTNKQNKTKQKHIISIILKTIDRNSVE